MVESDVESDVESGVESGVLTGLLNEFRRIGDWGNACGGWVYSSSNYSNPRQQTRYSSYTPLSIHTSTYLAVVGHSQMDPALVHSAPHLRLLPERLCDQHLERQRHDLLIRIDVLRSVDAADLRAVEPHVPTRETQER